MSRHFLKGIVAMLLALVLIVLMAVPVMAADMRGGQTVTVASGEVVDGDLYAAGNDIVINGTVNGDVWAAGRTIIVNGTINGSVTAAAQFVTLNGTISRSARIAGQVLIIGGSIKTDLVAFGTTLAINSEAKIGSDLLVGCNTAQINGQIDGNIKGGAGEANITGSVGGNVNLEAAKLTIASTARIQGNLDYTSENEALIQPDSRISGKVTHKLPPPDARKVAAAAIVTAVIWKVLGFAMALVAGIIIILICRRKITAMADAIKTNPLSSLGWGALILFVTPIAAIVACCTVIGLPVGIIALLLYGIAIYLSQIPVALCIGRLIIGRFREVESKGMLVGTLATGLVILTVVRLIPVIGFLVGLSTAIFGLGSLLASQIKLRAELRNQQ